MGVSAGTFFGTRAVASLRVWAFALAATAALGACRPRQAAEAPLLPLTPCRLGGLPASCGSLVVPEDRAAPDAKQLSLRVAVVPAVSGNPEADPVYFLAGGPGQAATELAPLVYDTLAGLNEERELVFVDVRGSGGSNAFSCALPNETLQDLFRVDLPEEELKRCLTSFQGDPRRYTTEPAAADLEAVRLALGHPAINLVGMSYGTRLALAYARAYPTAVRSLVLDGVAPPQMLTIVEFLPDSQRALNLLVNDCASEPACQAAFPELRLDVVRLLRGAPGDVFEVTVSDPRSGRAVPLAIRRDALAMTVRGLLYSAELRRLLPLTLHQAAGGDFGPLVAQAKLLADSAEHGMSLGLYLSVLCAEDVPFFDDAEVLRLGRESFVGTAPVDQVREACRLWRSTAVGPEVRAPVESNVPTLILSGELDPATPPRWGQLTASTLSVSRHLAVPGAAHGTLGLACVRRVVERFVSAPRPAELDAGCLDALESLPFFVSPLGPFAAEVPSRAPDAPAQQPSAPGAPPQEPRAPAANTEARP